MLVLSRSVDEQIVIGEGANQVVITIVAVRGDKARVGIAAAKEIPVHRFEVYQAIHRDRERQQKRMESGNGNAA